jgi:hypothetical protein
MAEGSDTLFAEAVAARSLPHRVFLPQTADAFFNGKDFPTQASMDRSKARVSAKNVIELRVASQAQDRHLRFSECGYEIANACDVLIAAYDPGLEGRKGGTKETLTFARFMGTRTIEIELTGDMAVVETAADAASRKEAGPPPTIELDESTGKKAYLPEVDALKKETSSISRRFKNYFQYSAGFVVSAHVLATLIAGIAITYDLHEPWLTGVKIIFLVAGISLPVYLTKRAPQRHWATARMTAEMCRSVLALRGFPKPLGYLRSLVLPELDPLIQSLETLHLQASANNPMSPEDFASEYVRARINVQIEFYESRAARATRKRKVLECLFYVFSGTALATSLVYLYMELKDKTRPPDLEPLMKLIPIALPILAAACASLVSSLDLDRRIERFQTMAVFLREQRECLKSGGGAVILANVVDRVERALLHEVVEWYSKHTYVRGS